MTARSEGRGEEALWLIRHDAAHVMATAVVELWPGTRVSIGPPIDGGFYYDFEFPDGERPSEADLERIEEVMRRHIEADEPFERSDLAVAEAIERFRAADQPYKVELIEDLIAEQGVETVSLYRNGPFTDLCRGPHAPSTGRVGAFKLTSLAGAYWRGDERRQMLTRIYGTAFSLPGRAREPPRAARACEAERPQAARAGARPVRLPPGGAGNAVLAAAGNGAAAPDRGRDPRAAREAGLRRDQDPAGARRGALAPLRPLGQLPREHVLRRARRARRRVRAAPSRSSR